MIKAMGGDRWKKYLKNKYAKVQSPEVKVGILTNASYSIAHYDEKKVPSIVEVAFWNEFGTVTAPQRSFLRSTMAEKQDEWVKGLANLIKAGLEIEKALDQLGNIMVADVVDKIKSGIKPELAELTLKRRQKHGMQGDTPLMASREMITAIASEVSK